eukprot:TRINITY_DN13785_c0_g1_i1.p1 TRINITY_DN13785_c0_g1~~TRINITY_DN13785_c0_g1_i1.p1  ORF type:complete len:269 (+),score=82.30 TRINITY_DN13785_c0_g1_i1:88-807(+)
MAWEQATVQTSDTACWVLSVVEALRHSGVLRRLFVRDVKVAAGDGAVVAWATAAGEAGSVAAADPVGVPLWQRVLEAVFVRKHRPRRLSSGPLGFQDVVPPAMGMGMKGRAAALEAYLALVTPGVHVTCALLTPRVGLPAAALTNAARPPPAGNVTALVAQLCIDLPDTRAHAVAVTSHRISNGTLTLSTYDQHFRQHGKYAVRAGAKGGAPECAWDDGTRTVCDGIVAVTIAGLPHEV